MSKSLTYPTLSYDDTTEFIKKSNLFDKDFNQAAFDQLFKATVSSNNMYKQNDQLELNRYEFLELIIRIGQIKYKEVKEIK